MSDALGFLPDTKPDVAEPWRKVLLDAADYIEAHGWTYGRSCNAAGQVCLIGAIAKVTGGRFRNGSGTLFLDGHSSTGGGIASMMIERGYSAQWNDAPGRTASEVTAALRACARQ